MRVWLPHIRLILYKPWLFAGRGALSVIFFNVPLVGGLLVREVFNRLTGDASAGFDVWTLLAFFVAIQMLSLLVHPIAGLIEEIMYDSLVTRPV